MAFWVGGGDSTLGEVRLTVLTQLPGVVPVAGNVSVTEAPGAMLPAFQIRVSLPPEQVPVVTVPCEAVGVPRVNPPQGNTSVMVVPKSVAAPPPPSFLTSTVKLTALPVFTDDALAVLVKVSAGDSAPVPEHWALMGLQTPLTVVLPSVSTPAAMTLPVSAPLTTDTLPPARRLAAPSRLVPMAMLPKA